MQLCVVKAAKLNMFQNCSSSYPTQASGGGYQSRRPNPYAQQDAPYYEMTDVKESAPTTPGDMSSFYKEVSTNLPVLLAVALNKY
jgi:hypothetical protein